MTGALELQLRGVEQGPRLVTSWDIYPSYWGLTKEEDALSRCQICGQTLGKRCARDGCGNQVQR